MKLLKYISITLFLILQFVLLVEARQDNLMHLSSRFYQALPPSEAMGGLEAAIPIAHERQVGLFFVVESSPSLFHTDVDIYGDEAALQAVREKGFGEGSYASLFSGTTIIRFHELDEEAFLKSEKTLCLVGESEQIRLTVRDFHPQNPAARPSAPRMQKLSASIIVLWVGLGIFSVLMTWLEIQFDKKEFLLKMLSGASARRMMVKNILLDNGIYLFIYATLYYIFTKAFFYSLTEKKLFLGLLLGVLLLNTLAHLLSLKVSYKEVFYGANISLSRMGDCFILKAFVLGAGLLIFGLMGPKLFWGIQTLRNYNETKAYSEYSFLGVMPSSGDFEEYWLRSMDVMASYTELYARAWEQNRLAMANRYDLPAPDGIASPELYYENPDQIYLVNGHTKGIEKILSAEEQEALKGKLLILYPGISKPGERLQAQIRAFAGRYLWFLDSDEIALRAYGSFRMLAFTEEETMPYVVGHNPLMLFVGEAENTPEWEGVHLTNLICVPFLLTTEEADALLEKYDMKTTAYDIPEFCWEASVAGLREAVFSGTVLLMLIFLECLLLLLTVRFEYMIKAKELALKKILGYRIFEQNLELFVLNTIATLIGGIAVCVICVMYDIAPWRYILMGVLAVLMFEYGVLYIVCSIFSRKNTPSILKGGSL